MHLVVNAKQEVGDNDLLRRQRDFAADWRLLVIAVSLLDESHPHR